MKSIDKLLSRRVEEVIERKSLEKKLVSGKKLRVKLGIDPNEPNLHIGHAVPLMKLREFQDAGHIAVLIIGDWTAQIGDPSGKDKTRPALTHKKVSKNAKEFFKQAYLVLDKKKTEVHLQSEWFKKFGLADLIGLASQVSVGKILSHETFRNRLKKDLPFSLHETLYPLLQGYDSVATRSDLELGAMDQKFNVLMGRTIQKAFGQPQQDVLLMSYLIGLDGKEKMSKSLGNFVALTDSPDEMYGKLMSIPDEQVKHYLELCTNLSAEEIQRNQWQVDLKARKMRLALEVVSIYHGTEESNQAQENFEKKFGKGRGVVKADFTLKKKSGNYLVLDILVEAKLASSKSEARRKIQEGAVEIDGNKVTHETVKVWLKTGSLIRLGKRFTKIT